LSTSFFSQHHYLLTFPLRKGHKSELSNSI